MAHGKKCSYLFVKRVNKLSDIHARDGNCTISSCSICTLEVFHCNINFCSLLVPLPSYFSFALILTRTYWMRQAWFIISCSLAAHTYRMLKKDLFCVCVFVCAKNTILLLSLSAYSRAKKKIKTKKWKITQLFVSPSIVEALFFQCPLNCNDYDVGKKIIWNNYEAMERSL